MKKDIKSYSEFINEKEQKIIYNTNFSGMVQGAIANIQAQVLAIAQEMANEKKARNPYRYEEVEILEEVDITRAINLIFHSDWKKMLKEGNIQEWAKKSIERASKHDQRAAKKNQRAMRQLITKKDNFKVDLGSQGFSRESGSKGEGSNQ